MGIDLTYHFACDQCGHRVDSDRMMLLQPVYGWSPPEVPNPMLPSGWCVAGWGRILCEQHRVFIETPGALHRTELP